MASGQWRIDRSLVERIAKASRIELTDDELDKFCKQLENILAAFKEIDEVDTAGVQPSFHPQELKNVWREDVVEDWDWDPMENSKNKEDRYFKGSRIV